MSGNSNFSGEGFVRLTNRSSEQTTLSLYALNDDGTPALDHEIELNIQGNSSIQLNSKDLAEGNSSKGLHSDKIPLKATMLLRYASKSRGDLNTDM